MKKLLMVFIFILLSGFIIAQEPIALEWTNSTSEGVIGYNMYRSQEAGTGYIQINDTLIPSDPSGHGEWADVTVKYNKRYYCVCRAVVEWNDPIGDSGILESINSNEVTQYKMPPAPHVPGLIKKSLEP